MQAYFLRETILVKVMRLSRLQGQYYCMRSGNFEAAENSLLKIVMNRSTYYDLSWIIKFGAQGSFMIAVTALLRVVSFGERRT